MIKNVSKNSIISKSGANFYDFSSEVDLSTSLLIGLSPTNYHCFLLCEDLEYHPSLSMRQARMLKRKNQVIRSCIFFRITNLDPILVKNIKEKFYSQVTKRTESCHMGIYNFLNEELGMEIPVSHATLRYHPSEFIKAFVRGTINFKSRPGTQIDVYLVRDLDIENTLIDINRYEKKFFLGYLVSAFMLKIFNVLKIKGNYKVSTELRTLVQ